MHVVVHPVVIAAGSGEDENGTRNAPGETTGSGETKARFHLSAPYTVLACA
jgi:hypothetical protein